MTDHLKNFLLLFYFILFSTVASGNVIGSDAQNFNPTTSGLDFVTVQSSETLEPGIINVGLFVNYAINTLPYFPASGATVSQSRSDFNDSFTSGDFNLGVGLLKNLDAGISFPVLLSQDVDNTNGVGLYKEGLTEIRVNTKYRLFGDQNHGLALVGTVNQNQIKNNPFSGADPGLTKNLELAADTTIGKWALGGNVGYRWRDSGAPIAGVNIDPMPDQWIASLASSYYLEKMDLKLLIELYTSFSSGSTGTNQSDRDYSSAELLVGIKQDLRTDIAWHIGTGTEVIHGASSPDWRVYAGLNWTIGPVWKQEKTPLPLPIQPEQKVAIEGLNFDSGTATVSKDSKTTLEIFKESITKLLVSHQITKVTIEGHTDSVGRDEVNMELSQYRANTIRDYLVKNTSLTESQVEAIGYGETKPIADNGNYQGRAKNRRVEISIIYND
ncbi:MAG: OmpA family protein [Bdellovibrionales bacterium]|nr:OmpA family protein [Bdellovibrionales bacterium]